MRNAVQRPTIVSRAISASAWRACVQRAIGRDRDEGIEDWIEPLDASQAFAGEFKRRQAAIANLFGSFGQGEHGSFRQSNYNHAENS